MYITAKFVCASTYALKELTLLENTI